MVSERFIKPLPALPREGIETRHKREVALFGNTTTKKKRGAASAPGRELALWAKAGIALA
ncbi:hypothetical protein [Mucilaginibacter galii]|uniref:hypothetical protein n=1 Tax=Mucilaginibacter galii TaxID=2005073 RepID=UPI00166BA6B8|nr:hypothetical protein [Mucilaginibacter galii]